MAGQGSVHHPRIALFRIWDGHHSFGPNLNRTKIQAFKQKAGVLPHARSDDRYSTIATATPDRGGCGAASGNSTCFSRLMHEIFTSSNGKSTRAVSEVCGDRVSALRAVPIDAFTLSSKRYIAMNTCGETQRLLVYLDSTSRLPARMSSSPTSSIPCTFHSIKLCACPSSRMTLNHCNATARYY